MLHIALYQPEIPQNTGNIARTCLLTGAVLHLIRPLGFQIDEKTLLRAGMDYWSKVDVRVYDDLDDFLTQNDHPTLYLCETNTPHLYTEVSYGESPYLLFGRESTGLPAELLATHQQTAVRIPMIPDSRSLNLSNTVAILAYEVLRQQGFVGLS